MNGSESSNFICQICGKKVPIDMHETHPHKHGIKYSDYQLLFGKDNDS